MKKFGKLITLTGAYLGFLIGSGVATGQELMQYYSPYGFKVFGTAITIAIILIVANFGFSYAGKNGNLKTGGDVFTFYCGKYAGRAFDIFSAVFCYMSYVVMVSGGAATLNQQYNIPTIIGALLVAVLAAVTVAFGLSKLVDIIGKVTPIMLICIFIISVICLIKNAAGIAPNIAAIDNGTLEVTKAGSNWFMSGVSNGGFCILWLAGFSAVLGTKEDFKTLQKANIASSILLVIINMVIGFSILAKIDVVGTMQIPNLYIAKELWAPIASIFGILIFAAIYTSACPLLWTPVGRFAKEGTTGYKVLAGVLAAVGVIVALYIPFNVLMNFIYVINGYLGFVVLAIMVVRMVIMFVKEKKA